MKFNRRDLITRIEREIDRRKVAGDQKILEARNRFETDRDKFTAQYRDGWADFIGRVAECRANGEPVTADVVPDALKDRYGNIVFWKVSPPSDESHPDLGDLPELLELLKAVSDVDVTTAELSRLGFKIPKLFIGNVQ